MPKTQKELAFLTDLSIANEWTQRFADLVDKHLDLSDSENLLYINAGTGSHAIAIAERFGEKADIFATCENEDTLAIAQDKGAALRSSVDFSQIRFENDAFDTVLADATFIRPSDVEAFVEDAVRVARTGGEVAIFLPTAGSFGEIASLLWEALLDEENDGAAEAMITEIPTVSRVEELGKNAGLVNVQTQTATELFEYENGAEFIAAPLVADFLMPAWLDSLAYEQKERVSEKLARLVDDEDGTMTFRFSVKATLLTGEKD